MNNSKKDELKVPPIPPVKDTKDYTNFPLKKSSPNKKVAFEYDKYICGELRVICINRPDGTCKEKRIVGWFRFGKQSWHHLGLRVEKEYVEDTDTLIAYEYDN